MSDTLDRGPGVRFPPPLLFAAGFMAGLLLDSRWPLPAQWLRSAGMEQVGLLLVSIGFLIMLTGIITFWRARVAVIPNRPARALVTDGIYAWTRNPMYTGLTIAYLGGVLLTASAWAFLLLPLVVFLLVRMVIQREERHLLERFPAEYAEYRARTRRWL